MNQISDKILASLRDKNIHAGEANEDFIIIGADNNNQNNVVVVELKQWEKAEKVDDEMHHSVKAFTGGGNRMVSHPSYQAYSYATFIRNSSEQVQDENIGIIPCAYLHN